MAPAARTWPTADISRRLCHVLGVAGTAVDCLLPDGYTDSIDATNSVRPEKVASETALLLYVASTTNSQPRIAALIESVAARLIPFSRSPKTLVNACLEPAMALDYAFPHIFLSKLGLYDHHVDEVVRAALESSASGGRERPPHRVLEQHWIEDLFGETTGDSTDRSRRRLSARHSALARSLNLLSSSRDDVYAFTHALMYLSRFQAAAPRLPRSRAAILIDAESALANSLDEEDYDLAGELLLTWPLTGASWSAAASFGFHVLTSVEERAGFLPTPNTRLERIVKLEGIARTRYLLATAYHTTYVMGLLCAVALGPGRCPPASVPVRNAVHGGARPLH